MRKAIREFLRQVTTPPCTMPDDVLDGHLWAAMEIYEQGGRSADERARILRADVLDLIDVYCSERQAIDPADPAHREENAKHRRAMSHTEILLTGLIVEAESLAVRLPEAELQRYKGVEFGVADFPDFVASIYSSRAEPQQRPGTALQHQREALPLPSSLNTETARQVFGRAIAKGWMSKTASGLKWQGLDGRNGKGSKAQLAYLCGKVYGYQYGSGYSGNVGRQVPYEALQQLFNATRLDRALRQVHEATKEQGWRQTIDSLFD